MPQSSPKIAIPRLQRASAESSQPKKALRRRAAKACQPCRSRKAKCDEAAPICGHCRDLQLDCRYESGKREKQKRQFEVFCEKVRVYEKLLHDLSVSADYTSRLRIQAVLAKFSDFESIDSTLEPGPVSTPSDGRSSGMDAVSPCMVGSTRDEIPVTESSISFPTSSVSPHQTQGRIKPDNMATWESPKRNTGSNNVSGDDALVSKAWTPGVPLTGFPPVSNLSMHTGNQQAYNFQPESVFPWLGALGFPSPLAQRQTG